MHIALANARPCMWMACALGKLRDGEVVRLTGAYFAAVEKNGLSLRFTPRRDLIGLIEAAVKQNPVAIAHVVNPDPRMCLDCYRRNKNTFALFDDKGRRFVARQVLTDVILALLSPGLSPNLVSEVCASLLLCAFPRTYTDAPSLDELKATHISFEILRNRWRNNDRDRDVSSWEMSLYDIWTLVRHVRGT